MDATEIQKALDALVSAMLAKGLPTPEASLSFKSNEQVVSGVQWANKARTYGTEYYYFRRDSVEEAIVAAETHIAALPGAAERNIAEFMSVLGDVIDLGRERGIEVAFVNPLVETMKRLSENALTHQKAAAE